MAVYQQGAAQSGRVDVFHYEKTGGDGYEAWKKIDRGGAVVGIELDRPGSA